MSVLGWTFTIAGCAALGFFAGFSIAWLRGDVRLIRAQNKWQEGLAESLRKAEDRHREEMQRVYDRHEKQLTNLLNHGTTADRRVPEVKEIANLDANEEDHALLKKAEQEAMVRYLAKEGGVSEERAREEAEKMISQFGV